jgi:hypothetical protein
MKVEKPKPFDSAVLLKLVLVVSVAGVFALLGME